MLRYSNATPITQYAIHYPQGQIYAVVDEIFTIGGTPCKIQIALLPTQSASRRVGRANRHHDQRILEQHRHSIFISLQPF